MARSSLEGLAKPELYVESTGIGPSPDAPEGGTMACSPLEDMWKLQKAASSLVNAASLKIANDLSKIDILRIVAAVMPNAQLSLHANHAKLQKAAAKFERMRPRIAKQHAAGKASNKPQAPHPETPKRKIGFHE